MIAPEAVLSIGNDEVGSLNRAAGKGRLWYRAHCYMTIRNSLVISLALTLARLFDTGSEPRHPDERDVVSEPLLVRLMGLGGVRDALVDAARHWQRCHSR